MKVTVTILRRYGVVLAPSPVGLAEAGAPVALWH